MDINLENFSLGPIFEVDELKSFYKSGKNQPFSLLFHNYLRQLGTKSYYVSVYRKYFAKKKQEYKKYTRVNSFDISGFEIFTEGFGLGVRDVKVMIPKDRKDLGFNFVKVKKHFYEKAEISGISVKEKKKFYNKKLFSIFGNLRELYVKISDGSVSRKDLYIFENKIYSGLESYLKFTDHYLYVNYLIYLLNKNFSKNFSFFWKGEDYKSLVLYKEFLETQSPEKIVELYSFYDISFISRLIFYSYLYDSSLFDFLSSADRKFIFNKDYTSLFDAVFEERIREEGYFSSREEGFYSILRTIIGTCLDMSTNQDEFFSLLGTIFSDFRIDEDSVYFSYRSFGSFSVHLSKIGYKNKDFIFKSLKGHIYSGAALEELRLNLENNLSKLEERLLTYYEEKQLEGIV